MMDRRRYIELLKKYLDGTIDRKEHIELFELTAAENIEEPLAQMIEHDFVTNQAGGPDLPADVSAGILERIVASEANTNRLLVNPESKYRLLKLISVAAVSITVILASIFFFTSHSSRKKATAFEASIPGGNLKKVNHTRIPLEVTLEDGSKVILSPDASLSFPEHFPIDKREVYLTGEAFFDVAKKQDQPFQVYYNNVVTKVLGTSFSIKTNPRTKEVEVSVRTGKVQVSENKLSSSGIIGDAVQQSVILIPNQKATYNETRRVFQTALADAIYPILDADDMEQYVKSGKQLDAFLFQHPTSLKAIFSQLETVYGIEIIAENDNIYNCVFTGDVSKQEMLEKMHIVCLTIGATYEVNGTKILVKGKGCK